jgi:hypothetical protein
MDEDGKLRTLLGLTAGLAMGVWVWRRRTERERRVAGPAPMPDLRVPVDTVDPAVRLARALDHDLELAPHGLGVQGLSDGVIEITGVVDRPEQRARVVAMAHNIAGIDTVVNRVRLADDPAEE